MKFNDFLKQHSLGEKEISIEGIDEKFKIRQLSMVEQLEIMEKNKIELQDQNQEKNQEISLDLIKKNSNFRKDIILTALLDPKVDKKIIDNLNQEGLKVFAQLADEILKFTNEAPKQESKDD
ncbi:DNA repair protein [Campylobacter estrildidarum]|uniref:DNA repair protein n=1 Tax=Campylobacter estrildidarum TaxID=2510189 RepID=A0A4U7BP10_9BACT|nr:DNA repair protein [Campylobacter estrildidarum]TKX30656.1 DNA repair protein [Campylobacter estrildidarum]